MFNCRSNAIGEEIMDAIHVSPVAHLVRIIKFLNNTDESTSNLRQVLKLIGLATHSLITVLYKNISSNDIFNLECLGIWNDPDYKQFINDSEFKNLQLKKISSTLRTRMGSVKPNRHDLDKHFPVIHFHGLNFIPWAIWGTKFLYGFLVISWPKDQTVPSVDQQDFMRAVCRIFELWISNTNYQKQLKDIINFVPHPILITDNKGIVTGWNRAMEKMTGWKEERVLGKGNYEHAIPFYGSRRPTVSNLILKPNLTIENTYYEFKRNGDSVYSLTYCPSLPESGKFLRCKTLRIYDINHYILGTVHMVEDITHNLEIEKKLQLSKSMYEILTHALNLGIIVCTDKDTIYYNDHLRELFGIDDRKITLNDVIQFIPNNKKSEVSEKLKGLFRGTHESVNFRLFAPKNNVQNFYQVCARLFNYDTQSAIYIIIEDVTDQIEFEEKFRMNEMRLYRDDRLSALGTMAAELAHELNQPLNTIKVITDSFLFSRRKVGDRYKNDDYTEKLFNRFKLMSRQVERMANVINNIRGYAGGNNSHSFENVDVNIAIDNITAIAEANFLLHGIHCSKTLHPQLPCVTVNMNQLEQIIMNLLLNACQALAACNKKDKNVNISTSYENGEICIQVSDNATGITDDIMPKIFDPFFSTKDKHDGTGLGLSICQSIIKKFQGKISFFNNNQGGATFEIFIPYNEK